MKLMLRSTIEALEVKVAKSSTRGDRVYAAGEAVLELLEEMW